MSAGYDVDVVDLGKLNARIDRLSRVQLDPLLDSLGLLIESQTRERIQDEKAAPDGTPWAALSPDYQRRKPAGKGLLELEGNLLKSLTYSVSDDQVEITMGSNLVYAAVHQYGWDKKNIPARPYMGLSDDNWQAVEDLIDDFIDDLLEAS